MTEPNYRHTPAMGPISQDLGSRYEKQLQDLLHAGVSWLMAKLDRGDEVELEVGFPLLEIDGSAIEYFGILTPRSDDARELDQLLHEAGPSTFTQRQIVTQRVAWILERGWEDYVREATRYAAEVHEGSLL